MIERLSRREGAVYLLLAAYFTVNLLVRLAQPTTLEYDDAQQLFLGQWIAIGYDSQPPFYNWLQYGVIQLLGSNVLSLALLKNLLLFASYLLFGLAAHRIVGNRTLAVIATLALITFPHVGYEAQRDLSHTVAMLFAACMFFYFFVRTLEQPTLVNYAMTGVAIGIGVLSKYNFVLLPLAAAMALLPDREWRRRLFDWRILAMVVAGAAIAAPHAFWFLDHVRTATAQTLQKLTPVHAENYLVQVAEGLLSLARAIVTVTVPTLVIFAIAFGKTLPRSWPAQNRWSGLMGRLLVISLILLIPLVLFGGATYIKARWILPFVFVLPIYLCTKIEASGEIWEGAPRRFGAIILTIMVVVPLLIFARPLVGLTGNYNKHNIPFGPAIGEILASGRDRPSLILAIDQQLAGNLRLHSPDIPVTVPGYDFPQSFRFDSAHPVLAVWRRRDGLPTLNPNEQMWLWLNREAGLDGKPLAAQDVAMPYHYGREGDVHHFGYAWIYPPVSQ